MNGETFAEQFAAAGTALPGLPAMRRRALEKFLDQGLPTRRHEAWRYTDMARLIGNRFDAATEPGQFPATRLVDFEPRRLAADTNNSLVFLNGRFAPETSAPGAAADVFRPYSSIWQAAEEQQVSSTTGLPDHPLAQLNAAFARDGAAFSLPRGYQVEEPLHLSFCNAGVEGLTLAPLLTFDLAEQAGATVVLHFSDLDNDAAWTNLAIRISLGRGAGLRLITVQEHSIEHLHTAAIDARIGADATLEYGNFSLGAGADRSDINVRLQDRGASVSLYGAALALDGQHADQHISITHEAADTTSSQNFRGIAGAASRSVFRGKVVVNKDAQRINAQQRSDNLLLAPTAEVDARPELEIYADDVRCSHGATVGELDESHLFYLRSRGINLEAARALLTYAFANAAVNEIADPKLRRIIGERLAAYLPAHEQLEGIS